jgi:hypothetical protein
LSAAACAGLPLGDISVAARELSAWAPLANVPNLAEVRASLQKAGITGLSIDHGLGVLSLVGVEIGTRAELVGRALALLPGAAAAVFSHPLRLSCLIGEADLERAAERWHSELGPNESAVAPSANLSPASATLSA